MAKLIYVTNVSLDGYIEDERGAFDWFPIDWPSGRPTPLWPRSPTSWPTSRAPGKRRAKSSTPRLSPPCQLPTPDSNAVSTPPQYTN